MPSSCFWALEGRGCRINFLEVLAGKQNQPTTNKKRFCSFYPLRTKKITQKGTNKEDGCWNIMIVEKNECRRDNYKPFAMHKQEVEKAPPLTHQDH